MLDQKTIESLHAERKALLEEVEKLKKKAEIIKIEIDLTLTRVGAIEILVSEEGDAPPKVAKAPPGVSPLRVRLHALIQSDPGLKAPELIERLAAAGFSADGKTTLAGLTHAALYRMHKAGEITRRGGKYRIVNGVMHKEK